MGKNFPSSMCPQLMTRAVNSIDTLVAMGELAGVITVVCCFTAKFLFCRIAGLPLLQPARDELPARLSDLTFVLWPSDQACL